MLTPWCVGQERQVEIISKLHHRWDKWRFEARDKLQEWNTKGEPNCAVYEFAQLAKINRHSTIWRLNMPVCVKQIVAQDRNSISGLSLPCKKKKLYVCTYNLLGTLLWAHTICQELCIWVVSICYSYVRTYPYSCKSLFYVHINPKAYQWIPLLNHMRRPMLSCISRSKT